MLIFMYNIDMTIWVDPFTPDELYNSTIYYEKWFEICVFYVSPLRIILLFMMKISIFSRINLFHVCYRNKLWVEWNLHHVPLF
jgi:hypothetical protein